jgi:hypothetical protein
LDSVGLHKARLDKFEDLAFVLAAERDERWARIGRSPRGVTDYRGIEGSEIVIGTGEQEIVDRSEEQESWLLPSPCSASKPKQRILLSHHMRERRVKRGRGELGHSRKLLPQLYEITHS